MCDKEIDPGIVGTSAVGFVGTLPKVLAEYQWSPEDGQLYLVVTKCPFCGESHWHSQRAGTGYAVPDCSPNKCDYNSRVELAYLVFSEGVVPDKPQAKPVKTRSDKHSK